MVGQQGGWIWASSDDAFSFSKTVQVNKRQTMAEVAISHVNEYAQATITQIVSDSGVESPNKPIALRNGVTSVTFTLLVDDSGATVRWMCNFWS